jgi:hypothetical protein
MKSNLKCIPQIELLRFFSEEVENKQIELLLHSLRQVISSSCSRTFFSESKKKISHTKKILLAKYSCLLARYCY